MNTDPQITPTTDSDRPRLKGGWLLAARVFWVLYALIGLVIVIYATPRNYQLTIESPAPPLIDEWSTQDVLHAFSEAGISPQSYAYLFSGLDMLFLLTCLIIGVIIFLRRSDEMIGLLASFVLVNFGIQFSDAFYQFPILMPQFSRLSAIYGIFFIGGLLIFLTIFPDGRFVPSWTWIAASLIVIVFAAMEIINPQIMRENWNQGIGAAIPLLVWGLPAYAQWFRYRHRSNAITRQQIKWLALALAGAFAAMVFMISLIAFVPWLSVPGGQQVILHMLIWGVFLVPVFMVPISISIAIMRYRLWDIDIVINRSIVYGLLTLFLSVVFLGGFAALRALLHNLLGSDEQLYPAIFSAVIATALFSPARRNLRRFVDRRFYGIDLDYTVVARQKGDLEDAQYKAEPISHFGKYQALELIGRGGMGEVYRAQDPDSGQTVAVKTIYVRAEGDKEELFSRFQREAAAIEGLQQENIVKLFEYGEERGLPYMVMEYIGGEPLSDILRTRGSLPLAQTLTLFRGIAAGLDYAHQKGIVHRDIKPGNLMVEGLDGAAPRAVLMDFGIARMASALTALTGTGGMVGTLDYIAPEQIQGASQVDGRADVYALGVMTYQTLTGQLPFQYRNPGALIMAHLSKPVPDARELVPGLPRETAKAIQKAMAKLPQDRFSSAGEFVLALEFESTRE